MLGTPHISQTVEQNTACIDLVIPRTKMMEVFGPAVDELVATLTAQGMPPAGSAFSHHFRMSPDMFHFEVGFVTAAPITPAGRVKPGRWPAQEVAHAVYYGHYDGLASAWSQFNAWMETNKLSQAEDLWEHYVAGPHSNPDPATWRTELYRPLEKV